jgi:hypothetical protein
MGSIHHEVIGPDMVPILRPFPNAGTVRQPEARSLGLFLRHFQPFLAPNPLDALMIHHPAFSMQEGGNPSIAIPPIRTSQLDDADA